MSQTPISSSSSSSTTDSEKEEDAELKAFWENYKKSTQEALQLISNMGAGSSSGHRRRREINRHCLEGHQRLVSDYFSSNPTYSDAMFRRRFRMRRYLFVHIVERLNGEVHFFPQKNDVVGRLGLSPLQKCTAATRMLAYGLSDDAVDDYVRIGATTARLCLREFVEGINHLYADEYLRRPNSQDLQRLLNDGERRGFPGMLGSIDCMHWERKNCPMALQGQYARGHGKPTIVLEAVASQDLWIWHAFFGTPGTCNDINVLDRSPIFDDVMEGRAPTVSFVVNGNQYNLGYYLTDGIYPEWATFIQSIRLPQGLKASLFAKRQEAARKDVERAFGVLQARFAKVRAPAQQWNVDIIGKTMRACIIFHNMIVEDEWSTYSVSQYSDVSQFENMETTQVSEPSWNNEVQQDMRAYMIAGVKLRNRGTHRQLKYDLVEHIWQRFGSQED